MTQSQLLVLAIEPDARQAATLKRVVKERAHADIVVVETKDAAVAAIKARMPDVILVTALLSPRDEEQLVKHLRGLKADHLQTITIPLLASPRGSEDGEGGFLKKAFNKKKKDNAIGADPWAFGDQVAGYLKAAAEAKDLRRYQDAYAAKHPKSASEPQPAQADAPPLESVLTPEQESENVFGGAAAAHSPTDEEQATPSEPVVEDPWSWPSASKRKEPVHADYTPEATPDDATAARPSSLGIAASSFGELLAKEQEAE